jgi:spore coat polysaccharide biosynthesis predicted glycosyltransferase SpsG
VAGTASVEVTGWRQGLDSGGGSGTCRRVATLVFRCDANAETGLGHLARCRDLARLLRRQLPQLRIVFAGDVAEYGHSTLQPHAFEVVALARDELLVPERLGLELGPDARLVVDSYRLDRAALDALASWPAPWGAFDDFAHWDYAAASLVINTRVAASRERYRARQAAVGSGYFPAPPELEQVRGAGGVAPESPANVVVFIGGHDQYGVGSQLAQAAADHFPSARVRCVQSEPPVVSSARIEHVPLGPDLSGLLAAADLVLAGGGRVKYEAAYCLLPCASLSQTSGQAEDTAELAERGLCVDLGACASFDAAKVAAQLEELWQAQALATMRAAQARAFPADSGALLARLACSALELG